MAKKKKNKPLPRGRYLTSAEEMAQRDKLEEKLGINHRRGVAEDQEDDDEAGHNSDLDLLDMGDDEEDGPKAPVFEKESSLDVRQLIETANPNDVQKQTGGRLVKVKDLDLENMEAPKLSRREREALEAIRAKREHERLTALGQTQEAQKDLERLEEIRQERERQRLRREYELQKKEELKKQAAERAQKLTNKANNKKNQKNKKKK